MIDKNTIIKLSKETHEDKIIYDLVEDVSNMYTKIKFICPIHGVFEQTLYNHIKRKNGCPICGKLRSGHKRRITIEEYINKAAKNHIDIDNYDFSKTDLYERDKYGRISIICKKHGEFKIRPSHFINGVGCQKCNCLTKKPNEEVIKELKEIHPELDFSVTDINNMDENHKIYFICEKHGLQKMSYYNLRNGQGCNICKYEKIGMKKRMSYNEFIKRVEEKHGKNRYIIKEEWYNNRIDKYFLIVECPIHGIFKTNMYNFLRLGSGCPKCSESHLEKEVRLILEYNNIEYEYEKKFEWLGLQSLDFYISNKKVAIECQGLQHFMPISFFGGDEGFEKMLQRDKRKKELCDEHNIKLIYFSHENIEFPYKVITNINELIAAI